MAPMACCISRKDTHDGRCKLGRKGFKDIRFLGVNLTCKSLPRGFEHALCHSKSYPLTHHI